MKRNEKILLLLIALVSLLGTGCISNNPGGPNNIIDFGPSSPREIHRPDARSVIDAGDKLSIIMSDFPNGPIKFQVTVSDDGNVVLHLNQNFRARGKTLTALQTEIHQRYVPSYYPRMTVQVEAEGQFFFVQGHVNRPDRFPYSSGMTTMKAISTANGFDPFAKKRSVIVTRQDGQKYRVNCEKAKTDARYDLPIFPGDRINVPRRIY